MIIKRVGPICVPGQVPLGDRLRRLGFVAGNVTGCGAGEETESSAVTIWHQE
jgi:hypothetical protein